MSALRRAWIWLKRCRHSRGFGIQSPWAYRFVRYVVNEHWPYYAYDRLRSESANMPKDQQRLARLYFRLANMRQPRVVIDKLGPQSPYAPYFAAGCNKARIDSSDALRPNSAIELLRLTAGTDAESLLQQAIAGADANTIIVMEGIADSSAAREQWQRVVNNEQCITTFDLYYCGIIFFDRKRYKQHYIINF